MTVKELDFERQGEVHRDLIALLRDKSPHFAELIDKQVRNCTKYLTIYPKIILRLS